MTYVTCSILEILHNKGERTDVNEAFGFTLVCKCTDHYKLLPVCSL